MIKKPLDNDYAQIYSLLDRAFTPSISESDLVKKLKNNGKISFDFIIDKEGKVRHMFAIPRHMTTTKK
jgi:hypothetical protein